MSLPIVTNLGLFAGTATLGAEVLHMDGVMAVSVGFLVVMLKFSFELGRIVRRMEDWMRDMEAWRIGVSHWQERVNDKLDGLTCQKPSEKCERNKK